MAFTIYFQEEHHHTGGFAAAAIEGGERMPTSVRRVKILIEMPWSP